MDIRVRPVRPQDQRGRPRQGPDPPVLRPTGPTHPDHRLPRHITPYDALNRITGTWAGSKTEANQLTAFTYDTLLEGQPDTSTRYVGGKSGTAYTKTITAYDKLYRPTTTELTLPDSDPLVAAGAPATLQFEANYNLDGTCRAPRNPPSADSPSRPSATNAPTPRTAYDDAGRRTTQTAHAAAGNTTTNYRYEKEGQPPALTELGLPCDRGHRLSCGGGQRS